MKHFLEGRYFFRLIEKEDNTCSSHHGKILFVEDGFALVQYSAWDDHVPVDKPASPGGNRLLPLAAFSDEYCCFFNTFEEILACEVSLSEGENDGFASKWEAKMKE